MVLRYMQAKSQLWHWPITHKRTHARTPARARVDFQTFTRNRLGVIYFSQAFLINSRSLCASVDCFVLWVNVPYSDWSEWISCPHWLEELVVKGRSTVILAAYRCLCYCMSQSFRTKADRWRTNEMRKNSFISRFWGNSFLQKEIIFTCRPRVPKKNS